MAICAILLLAGFSACSKDDDGDLSSSPIVGTWELVGGAGFYEDETVLFIFQKNGEFFIDEYDEEYDEWYREEYLYEVRGNLSKGADVRFWEEGYEEDVEVIDVRIDGKNMYVTDADGDRSTFIRKK